MEERGTCWCREIDLREPIERSSALILTSIRILPLRRLALGSSINFMPLVLRGQRGVLIGGEVNAECPHQVRVHRQPDRGQNHRRSWLHPPAIKRTCSSLRFLSLFNCPAEIARLHLLCLALSRSFPPFRPRRIGRYCSKLISKLEI